MAINPILAFFLDTFLPLATHIKVNGIHFVYRRNIVDTRFFIALFF
jgi:hypothetical protein